MVPYANDQFTEIENSVINHVSAFNRDLTVSAPLPGGGRQVTIATAYEPNSRALFHVTLIQYDNHNDPGRSYLPNGPSSPRTSGLCKTPASIVSTPTAQPSRSRTSRNRRSKSGKSQRI